MAFRNTTYPPGSYDRVPQAVKWLLISNIAIFLIYFLATVGGMDELFTPFALIPAHVWGHFAVWQLVTYLFLHAPYDFWHILMNMLMLWMFGSDLERHWGRREFLRYYFLCGIGAGICVVLANLVLERANPNVATIGASGAIFGLLFAFGYLWPDRQILVSFLFPIKAKYFVMIFGTIEFLSSIRPAGSTVSHVAHLGGMLFGFLYLRSQLHARRRPAYAKASMSDTLRQKYKEWKIQRARRKFEVYMRKRENDRDRFVH